MNVGETLFTQMELVGKMLAFFKERGYESGERLPSERALAERFGVGRNALREALFADVERGAISAVQHERIYEAVKKRDIKKATTLMETHFTRAVEAWGEILGDEKEPEMKRTRKSI